MTIAIIGPGAVGTTLAFELKVLPDTELIGRQDKLMTYFPENTSNGSDVKVTSFNHINQTFDVIIIAVKHINWMTSLNNYLKSLMTIRSLS